MISFISLAHAAESTVGQAAARDLVARINDAILFPLIALMMAIAFIVFIYGAFEYVKNTNNETARETGRNHLMWGVIGMLVMLSAMAILSIAAGTFNLQGELDNATRDEVTTGDLSSGRGTINRAPGEAGGGASAPDTPAVAPVPTEDSSATADTADSGITVTTLDDPAWLVAQKELNNNIQNINSRQTILESMTSGDYQTYMTELAYQQGYITESTRDLLYDEQASGPVDSFVREITGTLVQSTGSEYSAQLKEDVSAIETAVTGTNEGDWDRGLSTMGQLRDESFVSQDVYDAYLVLYNDRQVTGPR